MWVSHACGAEVLLGRRGYDVMTTTQPDALGGLCILSGYAAIDTGSQNRLLASACAHCGLAPLSAYVHMCVGECGADGG